MKNLILIVLLFSVSLGMKAQKVGYVNRLLIIAELPEVKVANSDIEALETQLLKKREEMVKALQAKGQKLEQGRNDMAPVKFEEEVAKFRKEEEEIKAFEEQSQFRIYQKRDQLLGPIEKKINEAIQAVAKENGYSYVLDEQGSNILYADEKSDITELVKAKLKP